MNHCPPPLRSTVFNNFFLLTVCVAAFLSVRCKDSCTGQPDPLGPNPAHVRFIHASTDAPAVDFKFDSTFIVRGATFNTYDSASCCYRDCNVAGNGTFMVRLANSSTQLFSLPSHLTGGEYYTVVLLSSLGAPRLLVLHDTLDSPPPDSARLRVIHAVPDLGSLDARLGNKQVVQGLAFGAASQYVMVHTLLPKPWGNDTGSFVVTRGGVPGDVIVELPTGHVVVFGQNVLTIIVLGKTSPNGVEPLATFAAFQDNFASIHGKGDVFLQNEYGAVRIFNGCTSSIPANLDIFNVISSTALPDWRRDFPSQRRLLSIQRDSMSEYLLVGFGGFDKDPQGRYRMAVRATDDLNTKMADSLMIDPFEKNHRYTCALLGDNFPYSLVVLNDTTPAPPSGQASVRLLNGVTENAQTMTLSISGGQSLFSGILYKNVTAGHNLASGSTTFVLQPSTGASVTLTTTLNAGETYTLVALGKSNDGTLRLKAYKK